MDKILNSYKTKSQDISIKDIDESSRKVVVYLSVFDKIDSDNDIIKKGAFKKSIQERGPKSSSNRKIAYLRFHDWQKPIGVWEELAEDNKGLYGVGKLSKSSDGMDALADYQEGVIREHSIGFRYLKDKIRFIEDENKENGGYYEVNEVALFEGSAVTFGANEYTNVVEVAKSEGVESVAKRLHDEINLIGKALSNGNGTDERLYNLEMKLKYLNARFYDLANNSESFNKNTLKSESIVEPFNWNEVINKVKI